MAFVTYLYRVTLAYRQNFPTDCGLMDALEGEKYPTVLTEDEK